MSYIKRLKRRREAEAEKPKKPAAARKRNPAKPKTAGQPKTDKKTTARKGQGK